MKIFLFLFFFSLNFYAQSNNFPLKEQDFTKIIFNEKLGFDGDIDGEKVDVRFETVTKDPKNPENYAVKGIFTTNGKTLTCKGKLTFNSVYNMKDHPEQMIVFGDFYLSGTQPDHNDGIFKGKFRIETMKDQNQRGNYSITTFKGVWENFETGKELDFWFGNFTHTDLSKVVFK